MTIIKNILILTVLFLTGCSLGETHVFVVPDKYKGRVRVVLRQDDAPDQKTIGDSVFYEIPKNGMMLSSEGVPVDMTLVDRAFYAKDESGNRKPIKLNPKDGSFGVYLFSISHEETGAFSDLAYYEFYVCTAGEIGKYNNKALESKYDSLMRTKISD